MRSDKIKQEKCPKEEGRIKKSLARLISPLGTLGMATNPPLPARCILDLDRDTEKGPLLSNNEKPNVKRPTVRS